MKTIYLAIAREDDWETSSKIVGMYNSVEEARADLSKRFIDIKDKNENEFLWQDAKYTCPNVKAVAYFYGATSTGWNAERYEIAILKQEI